MTPKRHSLSVVPAMLPDQTLYSWTTMFHELAGNVSEDETRLQLFGSFKAGRHFHIPSHLDVFCGRTQLVHGTPEHIVATRTVIPYFTRFRSTSVNRDTLGRLRGETAAGVSQLLGMWKTGSYGALSCRGCPECMSKDKFEFGFAYWHRAHQLPGVLVCQIHKCPLLVGPIEIGHRYHSRFIVPCDIFPLRHISTTKDRIASPQSALLRLANLAQQMAESDFVGGFSHDRFRNACKNALGDRIQANQEGMYDPLKLTTDFNFHFKDVITVAEIISVVSERGIQALWWLLEKKNHRCHPLEWMLIIDWLFGDWNRLTTIYAAEA